jgi:hypothetical protein
MVARSRTGTAALTVVVTSVIVACGSIIGIEDGTLDPALTGGETGGAEASVVDSSSSATDANGPIDSSPPKDAAPLRGPLGGQGGDEQNLPCGGMNCSIPAQICCAYGLNGARMFTASCATSCGPLIDGSDRLAAIKCSKGVNCPSGERCCFERKSSSLIETSCKSGCGSFPNVQLCDPDNSNTCPSSFSCVRFSGDALPTTWGYCIYTG